MTHAKAKGSKTAAGLRRIAAADIVPVSVKRQIAATQPGTGLLDTGSRPIRLPCIQVDAGVIGGRCPLDGYKRGWGLQFGDVSRQLKQDPLYKAARAAGRSTVLSEARLQNLYLIITMFFGGLASHNIIEFGAYQGGSAVFMAYLLREVAPEAKVFALDTFEGIPDSNTWIDHHRSQDFADSKLDKFFRTRDRLKLHNLEIIRGRFEDEFPKMASRDLTFGLSHIDCDTFSSVTYSEQAVWPYMTRGGYVIFDDANTSSCLGAVEAVENLIMSRKLHSEQVWPHLVFRVGM